MKVLIGYDGSDSAKAAIRGLHRAGLPHDAEVLVISVADVWPPLPHSACEPDTEDSGWQKSPIVMKARALAAASRAEAQTLAAEGAEIVKTEFLSWKVSHAAYAGSPYLALIQPSEGAQDLVVVGAQGGSALQRLMLGSVSQKVLRHAACSVRISRRNEKIKVGARTFAPVRIILGVDGSKNSASAVSAVAKRPWPAGTEVKVVTALDLKFWSALAIPGSSGWASAWTWTGEGDGQSWARDAAQKVAEELRVAGLVSTAVVEEGDPKQVLMAEAEKWGADCIFVGAKGHSALDRFLLGSVSASVSERVYCSVEVVR